MADDRAYRILLQFDGEHERFRARVPELDIDANGGTRAEALEAAESAIEAEYEAAATDDESGKALPPPVDVQDVPESLTVQLSVAIARELKYHADRSKMTSEALAEQLLSRAVGLLNVGLRPPPRPRTEKAAEAEKQPNSEGNERNDRNDRGGRNNSNNKGRGRGRGRRGEGYRPEIEDQANFLAYVRDMEKGGRGRR